MGIIICLTATLLASRVSVVGWKGLMFMIPPNMIAERVPKEHWGSNSPLGKFYCLSRTLTLTKLCFSVLLLKRRVHTIGVHSIRMVRCGVRSAE